MSLSLLSSPEAVRSAMAEYDELGQEKFLERYGYRPARAYFLEEGGRRYDSKAIAGVAVGKQYPDRGPLKSNEFSGGFNTVREKLQQLGFNVVSDSTSAVHGAISQSDLQVISRARASGVKYTDLNEDQLAAYSRVDSALRQLGDLVRAELGSADHYTRALTAGFHLQSGVRGSQPKDLWFGVYASENKSAFAGNPQVFAIASGRGLEYGFGACTHPSDFSNQDIKNKVRTVAPRIFELLPRPGSPEANALAEKLNETGGWHFRRKARLTPSQSDFGTLDEWLTFMHSDEGKREAGGGIYRYLVGEQLDDAKLAEELALTARIFRPLMEKLRASHQVIAELPAVGADSRAFALAVQAALEEFRRVRSSAYAKSEPMWSLFDEVVDFLENQESIRARPDIRVSGSLGSGNWARVPWVALLNTNLTSTTERGLYCVFLISNDLSRVYLTLNQGGSVLERQNGFARALKILSERASAYRERVPDLEGHGYVLNDEVDLASDGRLPRLYKAGTIAHIELQVDDLPSDAKLSAKLEPLMQAYDRLASDEAKADPSTSVAETEPYSVDDALKDLFMDRASFEKILGTWRGKKNIILQGAPGVGKSFVARRLAYALLGTKDPSRVAAIQFHQSYGYEDFVQGYRPTDDGGFKLRNGTFFRFCEAASADQGRDYVFIIDEINRGNLSKIFGELMLLIEPDKRSEEWGVQLAYSQEGDLDFHIPPNIHIIGMMNTADRSLSMVDYALRRRFAFFELDPGFQSAAFRNELEKRGISSSVVDHIVEKMSNLNSAIAGDKANLGPGFRIGHSFFVPAANVDDAEAWSRRIMETEIYPLLQEYWFDEPGKADGWYAQLSS